MDKKIILIVLGSAVALAGCGRNSAEAIPAAPGSAFRVSDFDTAAETVRIDAEIPVIVRDPFQKPGGSPMEVQAPGAASASVEAVVEAEPEAPPRQEVIWPAIVLSGMVCEADGTWCAGVDGRALKAGDWITPSIRILKTDPNGILLEDKSGDTRRISINKKGI